MMSISEILSSFDRDRPKTLLLDRDGVINKRMPTKYVSSVNDFELFDQIPDALHICKQFFDYVFIVTNQQGIGKGLMTTENLYQIHDFFLKQINNKDHHYITDIFYCPHLKSEHCSCRKPNIGMGSKIKSKYPKVDFKNALMVGDSQSDMVFGRNLGSKTALILTKKDEMWTKKKDSIVDIESSSFFELAQLINNHCISN